MINIEDVIRSLSGNAQAMRSLIKTTSDEQATWKPGPDTWSVREVMEHIYDEERIDFRAHLKEMFADPPQPWGFYEREKVHSDEPCRQILDKFMSEREASIKWLRTLNSPDWDIVTRVKFEPAGKEYSYKAGDVLVSWVEHDYLHLRQINELLHAWNERQAEPFSVRYGGGW